MAGAAALASCFTYDDISQASTRTNGSDKTPVLKLIKESHAKGYDFICIPLTTPKWRERWRNMCIVPSASTDGTEETATIEQQAEAWRKAPSFLLEEVTISRLGKRDLNGSCSMLINNVTDEAIPILVMASEWLQLDSTDDWVRHDSEIVSSVKLCCRSVVERSSRWFLFLYQNILT
jgi:type II protein arginine methyltransferase